MPDQDQIIAPDSLRALLEAAKVVGVDRAAILARAQLSETAIGAARAHWSDLLRLLRALRDLGVNDQDFEALGAATVQVQAWLPYRRFIAMVSGPEQLFRLAAEWIGPNVLAPLSSEFTVVDKANFTYQLSLPDSLPGKGAQEWRDLVSVTVGSVRALTTLAGLPPAHVEAEVTASQATLRIAVSDRSRLSAVRRAVKRLTAPTVLLDELATQQRALRRRNRELSESRRNLAQVVDKLPDAVVVVCADVILYANPAFAAIVGAPNAAALVNTILASHFSGAQLADVRRHFGGEPRSSRREGTLQVRCGAEERLVEFAPPEPVRFDGKDCALAIARDITSRKQIEEHLVRTDRMMSLGRMAAGVAHELNNPLAYVTMNISLIERTIGRLPADAHRESLQTAIAAVRHGVSRATTIVKDLSTFSRPQPETPEAVLIAEVLDAAVAMTRKQTQARATVMIKVDSPARVLANRARLEQVFVNLLLNAAGAFPSDDPVKNHIDVTTFCLDGTVVVRVADNGVGIPASIRDHIFDPFFTTKTVSEGSGLGLSICHGIVTRFGGDIEVETEVGRGTAFIVSLVQEASQSSDAPAPPTAARGRKVARSRVLVIDDEVALAAVIKDLLADTHEVVVASSGTRAMALLAEDDRFDCVLCDLMLEDLSGIDLYDRLQRLDSQLVPRIVFMTGGAFTDSAREFLARIDNPCLEKPFSMDRLLDIIADISGTATSPPSAL